MQGDCERCRDGKLPWPHYATTTTNINNNSKYNNNATVTITVTVTTFSQWQ